MSSVPQPLYLPSFSSSPIRHNIIHDKPHDLTSRWSGASVAAMPAASTSGMSVPSTSTSANNPTPSASGSGNGGSSPLLSGTDGWTSTSVLLNSGRASGSGTPTSTGGRNNSAANQSSQTFLSNVQGGTTGSSSASRQYIILKLEKAAVVREFRDRRGLGLFESFENLISFAPSSAVNRNHHLRKVSQRLVFLHWKSEKELLLIYVRSPSPQIAAHPCNLRDFKVYGAFSLPALLSNETEEYLTESSSSATGTEKGIQNAVAISGGWIKLLRGGLRNDSIPETFALRWKDSQGVAFSVRYIKLVPLAAHQPNYNFSVWHISLAGVIESKVVDQVCREWKQYRETMATRLILKHLRASGHHSAFSMLLESSGLGNPETSNLNPNSLARGYNTSPINRLFEHPLLQSLYDALCRRGAWDEVEQCLERAALGDSGGTMDHSIDQPASITSDPSSSDQPLFSHYVHLTTPRTSWSQLFVTDADGDRPSGRGGHQTVFDPDRGILYLFGGWDGRTDLCDLWAYHINESRWRCISYDTRIQNGPGPRSCHKMVFDRRTGFIYILGRYLDFEKAHEVSGSGSPFNRSGTPAAAAVGSSPQVSSDDASSAARTARRTFLPPGPGSSREESSEELFISGRGGSTRLGVSGGSGLNPSSRLNPTSGTGANSPSQQQRSSSPSDNSTSSARAAASAAQPPGRFGVESDFFCFSTRNERWTCLSNDTSTDGGPKLLFDHQMAIDSETQLLYVFGGRVVHHDPGRTELSGMWRYDVIQRSWTFLFDDDSCGARVPSRTGHSMLLDSNPGFGSGGRQIWILGGQRGDAYLASMYTYNLSTGAVREVSRDYSADGPEGGFTQRVAINPNARELYLFSGLTPTKKIGTELKNSFWMYKIEEAKWSLIYQSASSREEERSQNARNDDEETTTSPPPFSGGTGGTSSNLDPGSDDSFAFFPRSPEPRPRYAVQMVHDIKNACFYLFGGNPLDGQSPDLRLGDFWKMDLVRPTANEVLRRAQFKVRKQRFLEMASQAKSASGGLLAMNALVYLQNQVGSCVDHSNETESTAFRKLMTNLFGQGEGTQDEEMHPGEISDPDPNNTPKVQKVQPSLRSPLSDDDDGLPDDDEDSEMLSISQTLPAGESGQGERSGKISPALSSSGSNQPINSKQAFSQLLIKARGEGKPTDLYSQRVALFQDLLEFFPPSCTQPTDMSLSDCIEFGMTQKVTD